MVRSWIKVLMIVACIIAIWLTTALAQNDPVLWYRFNETGGATAYDSSGSGKNAVLVNGPTWVSGREGNAVNLDGSNDYLSLPAGIVSALNDFTIAAWVRLDTVSTWSRIFDFGTGTNVNMFLTPRSSSGSIRFAITTGGSGSEQRINGSSALPAGTWKHVAVTLSGNTGILYVDGVEVGRNSNMTLRPSSLGNTGNNYIGRSQYSDPYLDGSIDDFRIYDRAISAAEVQELFGGVVTTPTPTSTSGTQPVWSGGPYLFNGSNPVTTSGNIGISGNSPWSMAAWVYPFTGGPNDGYGWGIIGWGSAATNQGNFLYYNDAERTFEYGFYSNDGQTAANYDPYTWYLLPIPGMERPSGFTLMVPW